MELTAFLQHCDTLRHGGKPVAPDAWPRVIVLVGDDGVQRKKGVASVAALHPDFDHQTYRYDLRSDATEAWLNECYTFPMGAVGKLVHLRVDTAWVKANKDTVKSYLASPSETAALVLEADKLGKRELKHFDADGVVTVTCDPPEAASLVSWVLSAAKARGKGIARPAAELLVERAAGKTTAIDTQLEKLALHAGANKEITVEDVLSLTQDDRTYDTFTLVGTILKGDVAAALRMYHGMLEHGGDISPVIGALAWKLRELINVRMLLDSGMPEGQVAAAMKIQAYRMKYIRRELGGRSAEQLSALHRILLETEENVKTGMMSAVRAGEWMIVRMAA
jgi:DNA polymerase-3 subunit delta